MKVRSNVRQFSLLADAKLAVSVDVSLKTLVSWNGLDCEALTLLWGGR